MYITMEKILKISKKMTIELQVIFNRNIRIIEVSERQEENPYKEATVKKIITEKFKELKNTFAHIQDAQRLITRDPNKNTLRHL